MKKLENAEDCKFISKKENQNGDKSDREKRWNEMQSVLITLILFSVCTNIARRAFDRRNR